MNASAAIQRQNPGVGTATLRREDFRFLTGKGCYVDDIKLPGMLHAVVIRSPIAHGRILKIDASAALAVQGVHAFITAEDIKDYARQIPVPPPFDMPGYERFLEWPLAVDVVRFVGEPVAVLVADNRYIAEDATNLVDIGFEPYEAVTNIDQALTDKVLVHETAGTNMACKYDVSRGDADAAFANAHYVRKDVFRIHRHSGMPMETRGNIAHWDEATGKLICYGANGRPRGTRDLLASMLKLRKDDVTLIENDVGGAFGVRGHFYPEDLFTAFLSIKLKRPVKYIEDRREHIMTTNHSREGACELEAAFDKDGYILGMRARVFTDLGAYCTCAGAAVVPAKTVQFIPGPYDVENFSCELNVLITNKTPVGAYRGPGRYEAAFYTERLLDMAAADLGIDPLELRKKNLIRKEQLPYKGGMLVPYMGESDYDTGDYHQTLEHALKLFNYEEVKQLNGKFVDGKWHGIAVSCYVDSTGVGPSEDARIVVKSPTEVEVSVGSSSCGQGIQTVMAQVAVEQLGIPFESINVLHGSTHLVPNGNGYGHSRCAVMGGSAVHIATRNLIDKIVQVAALRYNEAPENIAYRDGALFRKGESEALASFAEFVEAVQKDMGGIEALQAEGTFLNKDLTYSYGTQIAHVAVDPETAIVDVVRFLTVEDIGRAINPMIVHGQTIGASVQGLSGTFMDEFVYDESGQILTGSFADYLVATATDFPCVEADSLQEAPSKLNPLGVKGAGEGAISATGGVLANAVSNALAPIGVQIYDLPMSPNNLARLIRDAAAGKDIRPATGAAAKFGLTYSS
ncbi:xanthine dehydrogenase family protein molybdopterin-binding subunit [Ferrovibrio sp. MS7]|uniref:xanthine dehydrogenase family protein molybdopterin-binding subunit n=1 Tax=Ferrovibrio plantarum TaxID=3119164 RepID=UPI003135EB15